MENFVDWLEHEMAARNWKQADLVRATGLKSSTVSNIMNGERRVGIDACNAIAKAFRIPPETVQRAAGLMPPAPDIDEKIEKIIHLASGLPDEDKEEILAQIELRIRRAEERARAGVGTKNKKKTAAS